MLPLSNLLVFQTHLESFTKYGSLGTSLGDRFDLDIGSNSHITVVDMEVVREGALVSLLCFEGGRSAYPHITDGKAETQKWKMTIKVLHPILE